MWRAWYLFRLVPGIKVARTHKILHHRRPELFPLLDNRTLRNLRTMESWSHIHDDLTQQAEMFRELEEWFDGLRRPCDVPLLRLRLHDILLCSTPRASVTERAASASRCAQKGADG